MLRAAIRALTVSLLLALLPLTAAKAQNWDATFAATPEGGHRLGNPRAPTRLITFISYTCPHCYDFEIAAEGPLRISYVQTGRVSLEVRPMLRNAVDLALTLAAECGVEDKFWANHRAIIRAHPRIMGQVQLATAAQQARWNSGAVSGRMRAIASDIDLYTVMEPRGYSRTQLDQCLGDEARAQAIATRSQGDWGRFNIEGTPSFAINGTLVADTYGWPGLRTRLDAAVAASR
jgi:protein-disulfide isomerase